MKILRTNTNTYIIVYATYQKILPVLVDTIRQDASFHNLRNDSLANEIHLS